MKVLFLFLLVAGPCCVRGQRLDLPVPGWRPAPVAPGLRDPGWERPDTTLQRVFLSSGRAEVRVLLQDRMPCVVANLALVEQMPVDRRGNADRMPNGMGRRR